QRRDDGLPRAVDDRTGLRFHHADVAAADLACQPRQAVVAGALAAVVHEQAVVGDGAVPGQASARLDALLADGEIEPGAERDALQALMPDLLLGRERRGLFRPGVLALGRRGTALHVLAEPGAGAQPEGQLGARGRLGRGLGVAAVTRAADHRAQPQRERPG